MLSLLFLGETDCIQEDTIAMVAMAAGGGGGGGRGRHRHLLRPQGRRPPPQTPRQPHRHANTRRKRRIQVTPDYL